MLYVLGYEAKALLGGARPQSEAFGAGIGSQLQVPARAGIYCTGDGSLVIMRRVKAQTLGKPKGEHNMQRGGTESGDP